MMRDVLVSNIVEEREEGGGLWRQRVWGETREKGRPIKLAGGNQITAPELESSLIPNVMTNRWNSNVGVHFIRFAHSRYPSIFPLSQAEKTAMFRLWHLSKENGVISRFAVLFAYFMKVQLKMHDCFSLPFLIRWQAAPAGASRDGAFAQGLWLNRKIQKSAIFVVILVSNVVEVWEGKVVT